MTLLDRKNKYFVQAALVFIFLLLVTRFFDAALSYKILVCLLFAGLGVIATHSPNIKVGNFFIALVLPVSILVGAVLFMFFFPNLSPLFRVAAMAGFSLMYYLASLVDNIYLVVQDRQEVIPLYRVATTWSQVLLTGISIPLFASLFKFNINPFIQGFVVSIFAFIYCNYLIWGGRFDVRVKKASRREQFIISGLVMFLVFFASLSVSFMPTESFLRALYVVSVEMFGFTYVSGHLKNEIGKKVLFEFAVVLVTLIIILVVFKP